MNHSFDIDIAQKIGLKEAIILQHIAFWIKKNAANGRNIKDGKVWTYNSRKAFTELFPYISEKSMRTTLTKLNRDGYIETANYNKLAFDQTLWYTITENACKLLKITICPFVKSNSQKVNSNRRKGNTIPDVNTDVNHIKIKDIVRKPSHALDENINLSGKEDAGVNADPALGVANQREGAGNIEMPNRFEQNKEFLECYNEFIEYRKKRKPAMTSRGLKMMLKRFEPFTIRECIDAIYLAIEIGYMGVFPKKTKQTNEYYGFENDPEYIAEMKNKGAVA